MKWILASASGWTPAGLAAFLLTMTAYIFLIFKTGSIAGRLGRSQEVWMTYAAFIPGISFLHVVMLRRHQRRAGPAGLPE